MRSFIFSNENFNELPSDRVDAFAGDGVAEGEAWQIVGDQTRRSADVHDARAAGAAALALLHDDLGVH